MDSYAICEKLELLNLTYSTVKQNILCQEYISFAVTKFSVAVPEAVL